jgi:NAD(P)-dependent dehydrogenase (short-subunit alcohol dehydrogenase family)
MILAGKKVVVTGGSRGLGLGLVEALARQQARITVVARGADALEAVRDRLKVDVLQADVTNESSARDILTRTRPDVLVLNAGSKPRMGSLDEISWEDFSAPWNTDVKSGLHWIQAALTLPMAPGARVLVGSSGAAQQGSPLSCGYAGAKRMLWFMARYASGVSEQKSLGIRFQVIVPQQMVGGTGTGDAGSLAYADALGVTQDTFLGRFGAPMPPRQFGEHLVAVLDDPQYATGLAFGLKGDTGITVLEGSPV